MKQAEKETEKTTERTREKKTLKVNYTSLMEMLWNHADVGLRLTDQKNARDKYE